MIFYRVATWDADRTHTGYRWFTDSSEAGKAAATRADVRKVDINLNISGMRALLERYASHPDNG